MIQIDLYNIKSFILTPLPKELIVQLATKLSYEVVGSFFVSIYRRWDGIRRLFNIPNQSFPTGLIHYVYEILETNNLEYVITDKREHPIKQLSLLFHGHNLRDYQQQAVELALKTQRGIIKVATGGGKTLIIGKILAELNLPSLVLIHKKDIFWQLIRNFEKWLQVPIGIIGDGEFKIEKFNVGMIQTVASLFDKKKKTDKSYQLKEFIKNVQVTVTDEVHHCASDSFWKVYNNLDNCYYRYGVSASPWREDQADLLIEACTAKKFVDISASELIDKGYLSPLTIYLYGIKHSRQDADLKYAELYDKEIMNNESRNKVIVEIVSKLVGLGKSILITVTKIEHGKLLEKMIKEKVPSTVFAYGESESKFRQQVLSDLNDGKLSVAICTTIFGEGIDIPNLNVLINTKAQDSSVDAFQLVGRVLRKTEQKKRAYVIDLYDFGCRFFGKHSENRLKIYNTEKNYVIKKIMDVEEIEC